MKSADSTAVKHMDDDMNLVELWLRKDRKRWIAGLMAGLFAGLVAIGFSMILAVVSGNNVMLPIQIGAMPFLGYEAGDHAAGATTLIVGLVALEFLAGFLGVLYAHIAPTNSVTALLGVGFIWGAFSWIFIFNLFMNSWQAVSWRQISPGASFFVAMVFGFSLVSVAFFDRMIRGGRSS